jgi:hypothetical protein
MMTMMMMTMITFQGNAHVIYNNNFYYYCGNEEKIMRYDMKMEKIASKLWP